MYTASGTLVHAQSFMRDGNLEIPSGLASGVYVLYADNGSEQSSVKIMVTR